MKFVHLSFPLLLIASWQVGAQERLPGPPPPQNIDTQKFCVYSGQLYSIGALIEVGENLLECRVVPSTSDLVEAGARWTRLNSGATD